MNVYICSAARTAIGTYGGTLRDVPAAQLGIAAANAAQEEEAQPKEEAPVVAEATADTATVAADSAALALKEKLQQESTEAEALALFRKQNPLLSLLNYSQSYAGSPVIGIVHKNDTAAVNAMLASKIARDILPSDLILRWTVKAIAVLSVAGTFSSTQPQVYFTITSPAGTADSTTDSALFS